MKKRYMSLIRKNLIAVASAGAIAIIIFAIVWPKLFYGIARHELTAYISNSMEQCAVRLSYMLSFHSPTFDLAENDEFINLLGLRETSNGSTKEQVEKKIAAYLAPQVRGNNQEGSISCTNNSMVITSAGDILTADNQEAWGKAFRSTTLFSLLMQEKTEIKEDHRMRNPYYPEVVLDIDGGKASFICCTSWFPGTDEHFCLVSLVPVEDFQRQVSALPRIGISNYAFVCGNSIIFQGNSDDTLEESLKGNPPSSELQYDVTTVSSADGMCFSTLCSYPSEQFYLIAKVSQKELLYPYHNFFFFLQICVFILIVLLTFLFSLLFQHTLLRLKKMDREMQAIRSGNFTRKLTDRVQDEIGDIARTINSMNETILDTMQRKIVAEKEKSALQYSLLVSAMDPHFIYNTLDTVTFLAAMGKTKDIITVNKALIGTLKDRIKMKNLKVFDTVRREKEVLEQYMIIESYLYAEPVDYSFCAKEEDMDLQIPKNILQPLVENAIKHGLMPHKSADRQKVESGKIVVEVGKEAKNNSIIMSVSDNGVGIPEDKKQSLMQTVTIENMNPEHIGIVNIQLRLQYLYGEEYSFHIENAPGGGTKITVKINSKSRLPI